MTISRAVVLAAGEGTRLQPLTHNRPKPMLPVGNRPILEYVLDALVDAGIDELHVVVGYRAERVQAHVGPTYRGRPVTYHHQEKQLGSGHALLQARAVLDEPILVINGDQVIDETIVETVQAVHADGDGIATLALVDSEAVDLYGGVDVTDGTVVELVDPRRTEESHLLNAGVYAFEPDIVDAVENVDPVTQEQSLLAGIQQCIDQGHTVQAAQTDALWADATYPWDVLSVSRELFTSGIAGSGGRQIHESARIHEDASITEPVAVGPDVEVGPGAVLGPHASIGRNVTVGANAVVENSVVDDDTRIGPGSTLVDCVTGQGVRVGAGSTVPGGPGPVRVDDRVFEDERLGAVLGDRSTAVGGVTFAPGTLVGPGTTISAGVAIDGRVPADAEVIR